MNESFLKIIYDFKENVLLFSMMLKITALAGTVDENDAEIIGKMLDNLYYALDQLAHSVETKE